MSDHENRALLHVDDAVGGNDVVGEGAQGILNGESLQTPLRQERNDLGPARAIRKSSVHKHDGSDCHWCDSFSLELDEPDSRPSQSHTAVHIVRFYCAVVISVSEATCVACKAISFELCWRADASRPRNFFVR
jgi:hypothetical protein